MIEGAGDSAVFLVGYRATGKSTVGRALASRLGLEFHDTDELVEADLGTTIAECFERHGERHFRDRESAVLHELAGRASGSRGMVVSTGGGIVLREENVRRMRAAGPVIWLAARPGTIRARLAADPATAASRPSLSGASAVDEVDEIVEARTPAYRSSSDVRVDVDAATTAEVVERIVNRLQSRGWRTESGT